MEDIFCKLQVDKMFPSKEICALQLLKISWNKLVIYHFWILKVTTAHRVFRLFLVLAMHWSSKCIGEAERDVPSYASTFGRSVIYAIMHSALCTPSLPPQSPIFAIMHGKPGLFTSCQFLPRIPPCLKTERSKLHQKIRNLTKEVKIELGQITNPINRLRVALNNMLSTFMALHQNHNKSSHLLTNSRVCFLKCSKIQTHVAANCGKVRDFTIQKFHLAAPMCGQDTTQYKYKFLQIPRTKRCVAWPNGVGHGHQSRVWDNRWWESESWGT